LHPLPKRYHRPQTWKFPTIGNFDPVQPKPETKEKSEDEEIKTDGN